DGVGDIINYVVRGGESVGPGAAAQPDGPQAGLVAATDIACRVVADHPAAVREADAAPGGPEFEETPIRLSDLQITRSGNSVDQGSEPGSGKFGALDVAGPVGDDPDRPSSATQADQALKDLCLAGNSRRHEVDV